MVAPGSIVSLLLPTVALQRRRNCPPLTLADCSRPGALVLVLLCYSTLCHSAWWGLVAVLSAGLKTPWPWTPSVIAKGHSRCASASVAWS